MVGAFGFIIVGGAMLDEGRFDTTEITRSSIPKSIPRQERKERIMTTHELKTRKTENGV